MGVFSRLSDIINSNINSMLEKAEDPEKIARLIIQEMEDTLVEVRTAAARSIADKKDLARQHEKYRDAYEEWEGKAELAISKGREDLARGALVEKQKNLRKAETVEKELGIVEEAIEKANSDMGKLQAKLDEAKAKHKALAMRRATAESRIKVRERVVDTKIDDALTRYELVERKVDELEAQVDSYDLGKGMPLGDAFVALEAEEAVEAELAELKRRVKGAPSKPASKPKPAPAKAAAADDEDDDA